MTKDDDFQSFSDLRGHPPRVIRVMLGNCSNEEMLNVPIDQADHLERAFADPEIGLVELA